MKYQNTNGQTLIAEIAQQNLTFFCFSFTWFCAKNLKINIVIVVNFIKCISLHLLLLLLLLSFTSLTFYQSGLAQSKPLTIKYVSYLISIIFNSKSLSFLYVNL